MYSQRDFNRNRTSYPQSASTQKSGGSFGAGSAIAPLIAAFAMFTFGGIGTVIGVFLIVAAIVALIVWAARKAAGSAGNEAFGAPAAQQQQRPAAYYRPQPTPAPTRAPAPSTAALGGQNGHLCEPGQHAQEVRSSSETLNDMQDGYSEYSAGRGGSSSQVVYSTEFSDRMGREQYQKKMQELRSLLDAGIISQEEYRAKMSEYSRYVH